MDIRNAKSKNNVSSGFADNERAIKLYRRCHFVDDDLISLAKEVRDDGTYWIEEPKMKIKPERSFLKMRHEHS